MLAEPQTIGNLLIALPLSGTLGYLQFPMRKEIDLAGFNAFADLRLVKEWSQLPKINCRRRLPPPLVGLSSKVNTYDEIDVRTFYDFLTGNGDFSPIGVGLCHRVVTKANQHEEVSGTLAAKSVTGIGLPRKTS